MDSLAGVRRWPGPVIRGAIGAAALAAAATAIALAAGPALAFHDQGRPWPGHTITYYNAVAADAAAVDAAVHDWNASGVAMRFRPVSSGAQAQFTILPMPVIPISNLEQTKGGGSADALGSATVGEIPRTAAVRGPAGGVFYGAHMWLARIGAHDRYGVALSLGTMERVAVHELGHILGLGHELKACAVMEPILNEGCGIKHPWMGLCNDPLEPDDIRGAVNLYGGREPTFGRRLCVISPGPSAPDDVSVRLSAGNSETVFRWRNPSGLTLGVGHFIDPYALEGRSTVEEYQIQGSTQGCPSGAQDILERQPASDGAPESVTLPLTPGAWCLQVRVVDFFGRLGPAVTVRLAIPQPGQASPPVPNFQFTPATPDAGQAVGFHDRSTAGAAPISSWSWNFGDGGSSTAQDPQHSYANPGTYTVTLQVTDRNGQSATVSERVNVA